MNSGETQRPENRSTEANKALLVRHYREIGPAAVVAALICASKDKTPAGLVMPSPGLGKAA